MELPKGSPQPITQLFTDLDRVVNGNLPPLMNREQTLTALHLDAKEPDRLSLAERLLGLDGSPEQAERVRSEDRYALKLTIGLTGQLLAKLGDGTASEYQRTEAQSLVGVAETQYTREGGMCPLASTLYMGIAQAAPEMVDKTIVTEVMVGYLLSQYLSAGAR